MPKGVYNHSNNPGTTGKSWKVKDTSNMTGTHPRTEFKKGDPRLMGNKNARGNTPWNKGTKGLVKAWNKGMYGINSGKDNPNWKGGYSKLYRIRRTQAYKAWRTLVFERDDYRCQMCGEGDGSYVTAHHIKSVSRYPDLALEVSNGKTLCEECHKETDNYKGRARKIRKEEYCGC